VRPPPHSPPPPGGPPTMGAEDLFGSFGSYVL